jgi:hypothetical protein
MISYLSGRTLIRGISYSYAGSHIVVLIHIDKYGNAEHVGAGTRAATHRDPMCMPINVIM